jgi:hypothetical protein
VNREYVIIALNTRGGKGESTGTVPSFIVPVLFIAYPGTGNFPEPRI